jgi:hypothetical protein
MMKRLLKAPLLLPLLLMLMISTSVKAQLLSWSPSFIQETSSGVEITADASKGNLGLLGYNPSDVYVHIGVITNFSTGPSNWKYVPFTWGTTNAAAQAISLGSNKWKYTISTDLRTFFGISNPSEKILKIAILFRSGSGSSKLANADGSDMYIPVYDAGLFARINRPYREPKYTPTVETMNVSAGDIVPVEGVSSETSKLRILFNGDPKDSVLSGTAISSAVNAVSGDNQVILEASNNNGIKFDTISFYVNTPVVTQAQPANTVDGINYNSATSVTLVLYAPFKTRAAVVGDFNNWTQTSTYQMFRTPDGNRYWITINGLTPGTEYAFQYIIDGSLRVADIYSEKILDPWNDQYIPAANYPSLKAYPTGQSNIVSVFQTNKPTYTWNVTNFNRPDKRNLVIYELLLRDFVATQNWQTLKDTISYLKRLGINAIELMPINEFEGNNSWGYNPDFFFAPDKQYGTETALKQFIDVCHANGIAVIMDIAMNHAFGLSPTVRMYWDAANNKPSISNPWHNPDAKHPYNVGYDFNHESDATKYLVSRVIRHWLTNYKIDGFRWDLSKGFTQTNSGNDVNLWSSYDASRVAIWKRIYDSMQSVSPNAYCILEHFAANSEEIELANYGMLLWGNLNYNFNEATKGNLPASNFEWGIYKNRNWSVPNLVTYQESHDEERLMYRNENEGNTSGAMNVRLLNNGLKRNEMATAFWAMIPGPKMLWQFGELGYDYSINTCSDGVTVNNNCRLDPKPIRWDFKNNSNRLALYNVYSKLFALRKYAPYLPTFTSNDIDYALGGAFKYLKVTSPSLKICVIGNFDVNTASGYVTFQNAGTWYDYLNGGTITTTGGLEYITLQPGEYHVYLDRDASFVFPLTLLSFDGKRVPEAIQLNWSTTNEYNVSNFQVERSLNGSDFTTLSTVSAKNVQGINSYSYNDVDIRATSSATKVYYRLKMVDKDGRFTYSKVVEITTAKNNAAFIYPNPVNGDNISIKLATTNWKQLSIVLTNVNGKACKTWNLSSASTNEIKLNIGGISNGIYFLKLTGEKGVEVYPLIIDHK